ncbi:MAG: hypothetical protein JWP14_2059 [Frankiales bacterium]|nr:hypothetical protein [Frankiales bacterium]
MSHAVLALIPALLVLGVLLPIRRSPTNRLSVENDVLRIHLGIADKLYCCRSDVVVPVTDVKGVAVSPRRLVPASGLRLPGASFPGVLRAGSYGTGSARDFWNVRRADTLLVIQMRPGAAYRRLVLEVPDPSATAHAMRPALGAFTGTLV